MKNSPWIGLKRDNIARSMAAGVPVGIYSELDRPSGRSGSAQIKKKKRKRKSKQKSSWEGKGREEVRAERDVFFKWRRHSGSFEHGKRR